MFSVRMLLNSHVSTAFLILATCMLGAVQGQEWDYSNGPNGPANWDDDFPLCGGVKQSPINIVLDKVKMDADLGPITFSGYDTSASAISIKNTGHSIQLDVEGPMKISGGKLPATYKLAQFQLHWGDANSKGSEHTVDGKAYPMELHCVHYNENFGSLDEAKDQPQGLAVIGVLFEIGDVSDITVGDYFDILSHVPFKGNEEDLSPFALGPLLPVNRTKYYRYSGSLTSPSCDETVVWTILATKTVITQVQMDAFRSDLYEGVDNKSSPLINNFRPAQNLNGRDVFSIQGNVVRDDASHMTSPCYVLLVVSILNLILV